MTPARAGIFVFGAVFVFCVIAAAFRFHPAWTGPAAAVFFVAAALCALRVRLKESKQ